MTINADTLRKLAGLSLSTEQMSGVLDVLADMQAVEEERKALQRDRVRRHRAKRCSNVTETEQNDYTPPAPSLNDPEPNLSTSEGNLNPDPTPPIVPPAPKARARADLGSLFDRFWSNYPSRGDKANPKKPARPLFDRAIAKGVDPETIIAAAKRYRATFEGPSEFAMQAERWLRNEMWEQYAPKGEVVRFAGANPQPDPRPRDDCRSWDLGRWRRELGYARATTWQPKMGPMPGEPGCVCPPDLIAPGETFRPDIFREEVSACSSS